MVYFVPWKPGDIAYTVILAIVFAAAVLEWVLWLAAFLYCLVKVYVKAENTSIRVLVVLITIAFTALRLVFLPVMVVTIPLPPQFRGYFPPYLTNSFQMFACVTFSILMAVPWLFCIYHLVKHNIGKAPRIKEALNEETAPKVVVVMPCYHEIPEVLMHAIDSACDSDYPKSCLHLFVSFDGSDIDELYLSTLSSLGVKLPLKKYPISIDLDYRGCRVTVSRFVHGGKRHCQKKSFKLLDKIYTKYLLARDDLFILFIDSDIILDKFCIQNFVYEMQLKNAAKEPSKRDPDMLAMTGVITCTAEKRTFLTILQDVEYVHGQLFERAVESTCGSVTCLPGALTMLRFSAFRNMAKYYFSDEAEHAEDMFDFGKCHLGEDRWLTHLFMLGARNRYQIQLCTGAFCKTEAVLTYRSLMKQRRRWFLGFVTNEACMLTDIRLWKLYPMLCIVRFMQNTIRTTALLFLVMAVSVATGTQNITQLPLAFMGVSFGLNWVMMLFFGIRLHRLKAWLYPVMFVLNPFFSFAYMVYGVFTAGQRTWGGPRADKAGDDEETGKFDADEVCDPVDVVAREKAVGVVAVAAAAEECKRKRLTIHPNDSVVGKFAAPVPYMFYHGGTFHLRELYARSDTDLSVLTSAVPSVRDVRELYPDSGISRPERAQKRYWSSHRRSMTLSGDLRPASPRDRWVGRAISTDISSEQLDYEYCSEIHRSTASCSDNDDQNAQHYSGESDSLYSISSETALVLLSAESQNARPRSEAGSSVRWPVPRRRESVATTRQSRWLDFTRSFFEMDDPHGNGHGEGKTWI
ncbi:chitin synthase-domain-containing protein [Lipomyces starkeyi]